MGDSRGARSPKIAPVALILLTLLSIPAYTVAEGFLTDSGFTVQEYSTLVSAMKKYVLMGPRDLSVARFIPGQMKLLAAGSGYVALIDVSARPITVSWAYSIIGRGTAAAVDDSYTPSWYIVGTDAGEVLAVNAKNPDFRVSYFTASRAGIVGLGLGYVGGRSTLYVLDSEGYMYIYKLPESGWFEIGPDPHEGPIGYAAGYALHDAVMPLIVRSNGLSRTYPDRVAGILAHISEKNYASVTLYAYYKEKDHVKPAIPQEPTDLPGGENLTVEAHLYHGIVYYPYNLLPSISEAPNASITLTGLYPVRQSILVAYIVVVKNKITGETVNSTCYSDLVEVHDLAPGDRIEERVTLERHGSTLIDCISHHEVKYHGVGMAAAGVEFDKLLVVNGSALPKEWPEYGEGKDYWMTLLWRPTGLPSVEASSILKVFQYESKPGTWPPGATGLLIAGVGRYAYIYLVDSDLHPLELPTEYHYVEIVDLGSPASYAATDYNGSSIFVGTSSGKVYWLSWDNVMKRYVGRAVLQVDSAEVTSLSYLGGGYLLVTTASGRIQLALLSESDLVPLWRGPYGYNGVETGLSGLAGEAQSPSLIAATSLQAGTPVFYLLRLESMDIIRVELASNILYSTISGQATQPLPSGSTLEVYRPGSREPLVTVPANASEFLFYIPSGSYKLNFYVPGLGYISMNATVQFPEYKREVSFALREVAVHVSVPPPAGNESYPASVAPGPLANAVVTLTPVSVEPALGLDITPYTLKGVTGPSGKAYFTVWDGVVYNVTVSAPGYIEYSTLIPAKGAQIVEAAVKPLQVQGVITRKPLQYYPVTLRVVSDRAEPLRNALVTIFDANNTPVYSSLTGGDGSLTARLLEGAYSVSVNADGYFPDTMPFSVPRTGELTLTLQPTNVTRLLRLLPYIVVLASLAAVAGILYAVKDKITRWLSEEEEYF